MQRLWDIRFTRKRVCQWRTKSVSDKMRSLLLVVVCLMGVMGVAHALRPSPLLPLRLHARGRQSRRQDISPAAQPPSPSPSLLSLGEGAILSLEDTEQLIGAIKGQIIHIQRTADWKEHMGDLVLLEDTLGVTVGATLSGRLLRSDAWRVAERTGQRGQDRTGHRRAAEHPHPAGHRPEQSGNAKKPRLGEARVRLILVRPVPCLRCLARCARVLAGCWLGWLGCCWRYCLSAGLDLTRPAPA